MEGARQQLIENDSKGIDVRSCVDVEAAHFRLLGAHVLGCADERAELCEERACGKRLRGCFGHAKVNDLWNGSVAVNGDQYVGWLEVAMDNGLLMRMLHGIADLDEQFESLPGR